MVESDVLVSNEFGLHMRAATYLAQKARQFASDVMIAVNDEEADGKSIVSLLMLGLGKGSTARLRVSGTDESLALKEISNLFADGFGEGI